MINKRILALLVVMSAVACKNDAPGTAAAAQAGQPGGNGNGNGNGGGGSPAGGDARGSTGGGNRGGRAGQSITLAQTDVAFAKRDTIEEGVPITGDLHPLESIEVRARIEGNLTNMYVREGEKVSSGQLLARFESSEQESAQQSAEADRTSAETDLAAALWNFDQSKELFKAGAIAERDVKVAQQTVDAARAKLAATVSRLRSTTVASRDTRVVAPTNGIIEKRLIASGEHVTRGTPMFTLVRNEVLELAAAVPERQANLIRAGQAVHFSATGRTFDGRVARVSPTIDPATRSISVYVQIPNADGALKGGTFSTGRIVQRTLYDALTVPTPAIHQMQETGQPYVYRIADNAVDVAPVQLGVIDERAGKAEVRSGVSEGDRVIVGNVGVLGRGMKVSVVGADDTPGGGNRRGGGRGGRGGRGQRGTQGNAKD